MKPSTLLPIVVLALALLALPVQAAQLTPTLSYDNTDLTTGTSRTISVTVTGSGSAATISSLSLSSSCLSVSDPSGGSYSSFSAATGGTTKDFVVTSSTAATCTFSASSLEQSQNSPSTSSEGTLVFVNPTAIGTTVDKDAAGSYSSGQNYTFTVTLTNSLNSTVSVGYNVTTASQTTKRSGDLTSATLNMTAGSTTQLNWSFSSTSLDTLYFYVGSSLAHTAAVTITASSTTSTGSSGGGGSATTTGAASRVTYTIDRIAAGTSTTKTISSAAIPLTSFIIEVLQTASSVTVDVSALDSQPTTVTSLPTGRTAYQFLDIKTTNLDNANIKSASLAFSVNSSWFTANNADKNAVSLLRYHNGAWEHYPATLVSEAAGKVSYTANVPGFSVFAITAAAKPAPAATTPAPITPTTAPPTSTSRPVPTLQPSIPAEPVPATSQDFTLLLIVALIIVVVVIAVVLKAVRK